MNLYSKIKTLLASQNFFYFVLAVFVVQAGWIGIHSNFPLPFDEGYHLGIIQLYAHQWSPFFSHLPSSAGQFGALSTDPSYLYHYLMSFPYRFITLFTHNFVLTIMLLRLINIGLFVAGILLFKRVLGYTNASKALINLSLFIFTLLPLISFTSAQINYDNLLFPVTGAAILLTLRFTQELRMKGHFDIRLLLLLAATCLLGAQVKYAFLPVFLALSLFVTYISLRWFFSNRTLAWQKLSEDFARYSKRSLLLIVGLLVVSAALFSWRYGYNVVRYADINPDCSRVMSVKSCMSYGVWARNYQLGLQHTPIYSAGEVVAFSKAWVHITGDELVTVIGNQGGAMVNPVKQLVIGATIIGTAGLLFIVFQWRRLKEAGYPIAIFAIVTVAYLGTLMLYNFVDYVHYGMPIAIQGRYLLPILPLLIIVGAQAYSHALRKAPQMKAYIVVGALIIGAQGGGMVTYLLRANSSWYWEAASVQQIQLPAQLGSTDSSKG